MDSRRFRRLKILYGAATDLPLEEIPEFLEAACPDDAEVRSTLEQMLLHGDAADEIGQLDAAFRELLHGRQKR